MMTIKNRQTLETVRQHLRAQSAEEMFLLRNHYNHLVQKWNMSRISLMISQKLVINWGGSALATLIASLASPVKQGEKSIKGWKLMLLRAAGKATTKLFQSFFRFRTT